MYIKNIKNYDFGEVRGGIRGDLGFGKILKNDVFEC